MIKGLEKARRGSVNLAVLAGVMWALMAVAPAVGQDVVDGFVDGFDGDCGGPGTTCNAGSGFVGVFGWATATTGIDRIEIMIESVQFPGTELNLGRAFYPLPRVGLGDVGWAFNINSTLFENGAYDVWARVLTVGGTTVELAAEQVLFTNNQFVLRPFGKIERPGLNEDVFGTCDRGFCGDGWCEVGLGENCLNCPYDCNGQELGLPDDFCCGYGAGPHPLGCDDLQPPAIPGGVFGDLVCQEAPYICSDTRQIRYTVVDGWALDLGVSGEDTGIAWVELKLNGALVGNTRTSCVFDRRAGGLSNCYGLPRLDLETLFPLAFDAPSAGYRFVLDVGALLVNDLAIAGSNELIVRAGDWSDQFEDIDLVSANFFCEEDFSEAAFGEIEAPREGRLYSGLLDFVGWALDGEGVDRVEVFVDGILRPGTLYGAGLGTRPLVAADYPGFQNTNQPVWLLADFDTTLLTNGTHTLQVRVFDNGGDSNFIGGEVTFRVDNTTLARRGLYKGWGPRP